MANQYGTPKTDDEKKDFVRVRLQNEAERIIGLIDQGKFPAEWGFPEMRLFLASVFAADADYDKMPRGQKTKFNRAKRSHGLY